MAQGQTAVFIGKPGKTPSEFAPALLHPRQPRVNGWQSRRTKPELLQEIDRLLDDFTVGANGSGAEPAWQNSYVERLIGSIKSECRD